VDRTEVVTRADDDGRTREVAACNTARVHEWTDARKTPQILPFCATFRAARRGLPAPSLAPHVVTTSMDRTGHADHRASPKTAWHRCAKNCHLSGRLLFTISRGQESALRRESTAADRPAVVLPAWVLEVSGSPPSETGVSGRCRLTGSGDASNLDVRDPYALNSTHHAA
jgi:hypothetical protein